MDSGNRSPSEVVQAVATGVSRLIAGRLTPEQREAQLDSLAACYAHHTDVRHPFSPLHDPPLRSRAELRAHFASAGGDKTRFDRYEPVEMVIHATADPEVVVAEFAYTATTIECAFRVPCIFVVRVRNGEIVESRDYADHLAAARAFGRLDQLLAGLARESTTRALAQRMHDAFNALDLDAVDALFAPDFYSHALNATGPAAVKQCWRQVRAAAPDLRTVIVDLVAEGDGVVVRSRLSDGSAELIEILRVADGRIAELWGSRIDPSECC